MKVSVKKGLVQLVCRKSMQPLMHKFYLLGLTGMNYGNANVLEPNDTGEAWVMKYIAAKLKNKPGIIIFDVGANKGIYALLALANFENNKTKIYAFEPSAATYNELKYNTANSIQVKSFNIGFSEKEESLTIYANYQGSGATTLYKQALEEYTSIHSMSETIKLTALDNFCEQHDIKIIDFLKIDVEGHELPVLKGGLSLIKSNSIHFIQFEFGSFHIYSKTFFKDFWDLLVPKYKIYRIIKDGIFEISAYTENLEIFRTSNFLAELNNN